MGSPRDYNKQNSIKSRVNKHKHNYVSYRDVVCTVGLDPLEADKSPSRHVSRVDNQYLPIVKANCDINVVVL